MRKLFQIETFFILKRLSIIGIIFEPVETMTKKVKRNFLILLALLVANVVGFFIADFYFDKQQTASASTTSFLETPSKPSSRILYTGKILSVGLDLLRKIGG